MFLITRLFINKNKIYIILIKNIKIYMLKYVYIIIRV